MNSKISAWLNAFRLRTLPLAFSSIIVGTFAAGISAINWRTFFLALVTTLLLQVLSNLANDYGDSEKGTDNEDRIGPTRTIQGGLLSFHEMKTGIILTSILAFGFGLWLVLHALGEQLQILFFIVLGVLAIAAAIKYTIGKNAYGYYGLGDLFVFLFFGIVGVSGSYYLQTQTMNWNILLLCITIGCFATAVLNLNNMRDRINDARSGKNTLVVKIGAKWAKRYHSTLIITGIVSTFTYILNTATSWAPCLPALSFPVFVLQNYFIQKVEDPKDFDPFLKIMAVTTFFFAVLFAVGELYR